MGVYIYGIKAKVIPTPLGPVNATQYLYKSSWNGPPPGPRLLEGRILAKYGSNPPKHIVLGDPTEKDFRVGDYFGIYENTKGYAVFSDDGDLPKLPVVGWFIKTANGLKFQTEPPKGP